MDLPFSSFELTFIIIAFVVFSLFSVISVCIQPQADDGNKDERKKHKKAHWCQDSASR
uniref:Small integral membrane protein 31 n=1 Tax=Salarias fasciatus TaxID=181472 RepID=A0A672H1E0_SALFA